MKPNQLGRKGRRIDANSTTSAELNYAWHPPAGKPLEQRSRECWA